MTFEEWLESCPDKCRFLDEFINIREDLEFILEENENLIPEKVDRDGIVERALNYIVMRGMMPADWNDFLTYVISEVYTDGNL